MTSDAENLAAILSRYARSTGKTGVNVLRKKGAQLGVQIRIEERKIAPLRGSIRDAGIARLKMGEGTIVRRSILLKIAAKYHLTSNVANRKLFLARGKNPGATVGGLNLQALAVKAELNLRESGRGFTAQASSFGARPLSDDTFSRSKYRTSIAEARVVNDETKPEVDFNYGTLGDMSSSAAASMVRQKGRKAVSDAMQIVGRDTADYLDQELVKMFL